MDIKTLTREQVLAEIIVERNAMINNLLIENNKLHSVVKELKQKTERSAEQVSE